VRPLLDVARDETRRHCAERGVPFADDPGNTDTRFERNRIRHEVLPAMRVRNPDTDAKLLRIREAARETVTRIRRHTTPLLESAVASEDGAWVVDACALAALGARERYVFFGDLLDKCIGTADRPGRDHFRALARLCDPGTATGSIVTFPGGCARREYDAVALFPGVRHPDAHAVALADSVNLTAGETARFDGYALCTRTIANTSLTADDLRAAGKSAGRAEPAVAYFDADSLELPLVVRHPRPGDRMQPFGMAGHRTLGDILSDRKVPPRHRRRTLVVEDQGRIIWLVRVTTSETTRVHARTSRVVRIDIGGDRQPE
jgi:tRNA(Ile)-lysidine synthase